MPPGKHVRVFIFFVRSREPGDEVRPGLGEAHGGVELRQGAHLRRPEGLTNLPHRSNPLVLGSAGGAESLVGDLPRVQAPYVARLGELTLRWGHITVEEAVSRPRRLLRNPPRHHASVGGERITR